MRRLKTFLLVLVGIATTACASSRTVTIQKCRFAVEVPKGWLIKESGTECKFWLDPTNWEQLTKASEYVASDHAVTIDIHRVPLEEAMAIAGLERETDGSWVYPGRQVDTAEPCSTKFASGQCVTVFYGRFRKDGEGGYQGLGDTPLVILSDGEYSAVITIDYGGTDIVESFRFTPAVVEQPSGLQQRNPRGPSLRSVR